MWVMVRVYGNNLEGALKIFKKQIQQQGLFKELKKRSYYEKPSVKRKRKRQEARKRMVKITSSHY